MKNSYSTTSFSAGWYRFAASQAITKNKIHTIRYFDTEFVCFRNAIGTVSVFSAYCPHLGAHLGIGGKIKNDRIVCPFHGWQYDATGECVAIPYCQSIPKKAKLDGFLAHEHHPFIYVYFDTAPATVTYRYPFTPFPTGWYRIDIHHNTVFAFGKKLMVKRKIGNQLALVEHDNAERCYPVVEKNGIVLAFYDPLNRAPTFDVPSIPEFNDPQWQKPFHLSWKSARLHAQEVAENALDLSHFCTIHTYRTIPVIKQFDIEEHRFNLTLHSSRKTLGVVSEATMDITYYGMGIVVSSVKTTNNITLAVLLTTTPIDAETVDIHMDIAIKLTANPIKNFLLKRFMPREVRREFTHDIPIWESKVYPDKPALCLDDANIVRIRKWAKQFYEQTTAP